MRVVIYDGDCLMCNKYIRWLLKNDTKERLYFTVLDGDFHNTYLKTNSLDSIIYYKNNKEYYKSTAIIEIIKDLNPGFLIAHIFYLIPISMRDKVYDFVAKRRKKLLTYSTTCDLLPPKHRNRFLD